MQLFVRHTHGQSDGGREGTAHTSKLSPHTHTHKHTDTEAEKEEGGGEEEEQAYKIKDKRRTKN